MAYNKNLAVFGLGIGIIATIAIAASQSRVSNGGIPIPPKFHIGDYISPGGLTSNGIFEILDYHGAQGAYLTKLTAIGLQITNIPLGTISYLPRDTAETYYQRVYH